MRHYHLCMGHIFHSHQADYTEVEPGVRDFMALVHMITLPDNQDSDMAAVETEMYKTALEDEPQGIFIHVGKLTVMWSTCDKSPCNEKRLCN